MINLTDEERSCFPILTEPDPDYRRADRVAGVMEAIGLEVKIRKNRAGYVLVLDLPEAG